MWKCKECSKHFSIRSEILKHLRRDHQFHGRRRPYPCIYAQCPCSSKTWNGLQKHLSRNHSSLESQQRHSFKCYICGNNQLSTEHVFFQHIHEHLRKYEVVPCMFNGCSFKTNIYSSFLSHKLRKHQSCTINDFKSGIVVTSLIPNPPDSDLNEEIEPATEESRDLEKEVELKLASLLLKLEHTYLVSSAAVNELLEDLEHLIGAVSVPGSIAAINQHLEDNNCHVEASVVQQLATVLCSSHPIHKAIGKQGPLSTSWKRKSYYKREFGVVSPLEYILDKRNKKSLQYVSVLKTLQQILNSDAILAKTVHLRERYQSSESGKTVYSCPFDGEFFRNNTLLSADCAISLNLYGDEYEVCNPIGTSRRKHKICGFYWTLGNLIPGCQSSLSSIYLALLVKSDDLKAYGYETVLEPLISDLISLEEHGVFLPKLGKCVRGTIQCVIADNLGAHGIAGFVESFSSGHICRFCTASMSEILTKSVDSGAFTLRTEQIHSEHLKTLEQDSLSNFCGVKRRCVLSEKLSHFKVTTGFPPDLVHDLFEGIVPAEIALCLSVFTSKKYFTLAYLNESILAFPFKWTDKVNCPHPVPLNFASRKTIGGNSHENWSLLRFFPFLVGQKVPVDEPAWKILTDLKDLVDLIVSPVHTEESIGYLNFKISEHRVRLREVFPDYNLLPKHHLLEHYPQLIRKFGPPVCLWTLRYEAKHSFFKRVVRYTRSFKNVLLSLAERHQFYMAQQIFMYSQKPLLEVSSVSSLSVDVLKEDIAQAIRLKHPTMDNVCLAKNVTFNGFNYRNGMILAHGSLEGHPEFTEIIHMFILEERLFFIVKKLRVWHWEHFRAFELEVSPTKDITLVASDELTDPYPLVAYTVGGVRFITLKRYIQV